MNMQEERVDLNQKLFTFFPLTFRIIHVNLQNNTFYSLFMRRITIVLVLLVGVMTALAGPITPKKAALQVQAFMNSRSLSQGVPTLAYQKERTGGEGCYYYIYTQPKEKGFVIVSGDDRTESILGYCDEGTFDANRMPDNMRSWLRTYEAAIDKMDDKEVEQQTAHTASTEVIAPLLTTRWNQDYPYNLYCPDNCPTGCVATAMAQVMYYHRWPQDATAVIPAYTSYSNSYTRPELPSTTFDWDNMKNSYNYGSSQASREAVAQLMLYLGQAIEMDYTPSGSGAQTYILPWIINQYFGYSNSAWVADRADFSMGEWDELLLDELRAQRPVLYTGYTCNWEGHAFVCDGYDGAGMYHINWGWGGYCDGYYRISLLDPDGSGIGGSSTSDRFSISQSAIIGWSPEEVETNRPNVRVLSAAERPSVEQTHFTRTDTGQDFSGIAIRQWIANSTGQGYYSNCGYGLFQGDEMVAVLHSQDVHLWPTQVFEQSPTLSFGANLADGDYEICPISTHIDKNKWEKDRGADRHFIRVHIDGNEMTLAPVPLADFQVNDVTINGSKMTVNLTNPHEEFNGTVRLYTDDQTIAEEQVAIAAGETCNIYLYLPSDKRLTDADIYYLSVDQYENNYFYSNGTNEGAELENDIEIQNMTVEDAGNTVYGGKIFYTLNIRNKGTGVYHYSIDTDLRDINLDRTSNSKRFIADIAPGEAVSIPMEMNITANMRNRPLQIELTHRDGKEPVLTTSDEFKCAKGATFWHNDGTIRGIPAANVINVPEDVLAAELSTAYKDDVIANQNPNTIYLLGDAVPTGLAGHNVVSREGLTGKIELYDGHPYLIPTTIQTDNIYYHHVTRGWQTLMLPFAPTNVKTITGENIGWATSDQDDSDFYLFQPTSVSEAGISLGVVGQMEELHPYFIYVGDRYAGEELVFYMTKQTRLKTTHDSNYCHIMDNGSFFQGAWQEISPWEVFTMVGEQMVYSSSPKEVPPFRTYLNTTVDKTTLPLLFPFNVSTDITTIESIATKDGGYIYNLQGQRVGTTDNLHSLPHGIYIINGKKTTH